MPPSDRTDDYLPQTDPAQPQAGEDRPELPGYELIDKLGEGGMGVVYLARQPRLKRLVAVKMIKPGRASDADRARFHAEAEAVARLQHPNIVQIHEVGAHQGEPFCVLEYVPGGTLAGRLRQAVLAPAAAARLVEGLARAMAAVHQLQVIHRDLKPANVLLHGAPDDPIEACTPKVSDFGLAKFLDATSDLTHTGAVMGTPSYMAPEQASGRPSDVTAAVDVWALGGILYESLTGRPPFKGASVAETLALVHTEEPLPPSRLRRGLPADLEAVCLRCLEKDPARRYASAAALAEDLRRFQAGEPTTARPLSRAGRAWKWARRKPLQTAVLALVAVTVILGGLGGGAAVLWRQADRAFQNEHELHRKLAVAEQEVREERYLGDIDRAHRNWWENSVLQSLRLLTRCEPTLRQWEWRYVARLCRSELRLTRMPSYVLDLAVSRDGRLCMAAVEDNTARVFDTHSGREALIYRGHTAHVMQALFYPDSRRAVSCDQHGAVHVWDIRTGATERVMRVKDAKWFTLALSQDGGLTAAGTMPPQGQPAAIHLWETDTGADQGVLRGNDGGVLGLAFDAAGHRLFSAGADGMLRAWDLSERREAVTPCGHDHSLIWRLSLTPDGAHVVVGDEAGRLYFHDARTLKEQRRITPHEGRIWMASFSADGRRMLTCSLDQTARLWEMPQGRLLRTFRGHTNDVIAGVILSDERIVTCGDQTVRWWDATRDAEARVLTAHAKFDGVAFSPDGRQVAAAAPEGLFAWEVATGRSVGRWGAGGGSFRAVAYSPDGQYLVGGGSAGEVRVWPLAGGVPRVFKGHAGPVHEVAFSPGGERLASVAMDGVVAVWDFASGQRLWSATAHREGAYGLAFSPDGTTIATSGADRAVRLWDAATGQQRRSLDGHTDLVARLAFSPDGARLVSASHDNTLRLWAVASGKAVYVVKAHEHYQNGVAFSPDGLRVADACGDKRVKLYEARTGREALSLKGHTDETRAVAFSPDGARIATCGLDGTVRIWEAPLDATAELPPDADQSYDPR
jgi:WD40 repeat protein